MTTQESINEKIKQAQEDINLAEKCVTELEQRKQELKELVESLKAVEAEQNSRAKHDGLYWYIGDIGQIMSATECNSLSDNYRYEIGNYYLTPEDAEKAERRIRLFRLLDRFSRQNGWTDELWQDKHKEKWYIYRNYNIDTITAMSVTAYRDIRQVYFVTAYRDICQVYFVSESVAQQAIEKYHDLIMEVMAI